MMKMSLPLEIARQRAEQLRALLAPSCERIEIAGSIRRRVATVGDIELVAIPRFTEQPRPLPDLFGHRPPAQAPTDELHHNVGILINLGTLERRPGPGGHRGAYGQRYKALVFCAVPVDLFAVLPPAQWGVILLLRTGPAEYSRLLVTARGAGGWCSNLLHVRDGALLKRTGGIVPTPEEEDVYQALGYAYVAPEHRFRQPPPR